MVVVTVIAFPRGDFALRILRNLIIPDKSLRIINNGVSVPAPVGRFYDSVKFTEPCHLARFHVINAENAPGVAPALGQGAEKLSRSLNIRRKIIFAAVHIRKLGQLHGAGKLEAGFHVQQAFSNQGFLQRAVRIFLKILVMEGANPVSVPPEKCLHVLPAIEQPPGVGLRADKTGAGISA